MKTKGIIFLMGLLLLNSCIVKSLNPFYTKDKIEFDAKLVGQWSGKSGEWTIYSVEEEMKKEYKKKDSLNTGEIKLSAEDNAFLKRYEKSYVIENSKKGKQATFIATPFRVNEYLFLNFSLIEYGNEDLNGLAAQHLLATHSVCLVEYESHDKIRLKWLDEKVVEKLIEANTLKIKHEKTGLENDELLLTASSSELYRFLEKFMSSTIEDKWEKDQIYILNRANAKS